MKYHLKAKERRRFFDDKEFADAVNLTQEEYDKFDKLEYALYKSSGKSYVACGYCTLIIHDWEKFEAFEDEPAQDLLSFWDTYGTEGESWEQGDSHEFERITGKFIEEDPVNKQQEEEDRRNREIKETEKYWRDFKKGIVE
jgi:hypothetical protein